MSLGALRCQERAVRRAAEPIRSLAEQIHWVEASSQRWEVLPVVVMTRGRGSPPCHSR